MYRVRNQIGCEDIVQAGGGKGITIAVLDTGAALHPDYGDRILAFKDFTGKKTIPYDDSGHGTHVCGIACGNGLLSGGRQKGIAPYAGLVVGKILDGNGDGIIQDMLNGIDWILEIKDKYNIRILNVSIGMGGQTNAYKETLLRDKLETVWKEGLIVTCAAGNNGPACETLSLVGTSPLLITVGCHDGDFFKEMENCCASYSSRGACFDTGKKPDIVAPGTKIISCNRGFQKNKNGYSKAYIAKSGTSMATPIISGALALLLQKHPEFTNETAKRKLLYTATDLQEPWNQQGWGMINIAHMMEG